MKKIRYAFVVVLAFMLQYGIGSFILQDPYWFASVIGNEGGRAFLVFWFVVSSGLGIGVAELLNDYERK